MITGMDFICSVTLTQEDRASKSELSDKVFGLANYVECVWVVRIKARWQRVRQVQAETTKT